MQCSKPFSIAVGPGVPWQNMAWTRQSLVQSGNGTASFIPDGGVSNTWLAATSGHGSTVAPDDSGSLSYRGLLAYVGPSRACVARMTIVNNVVGAFIINTLTLGAFRNGVGLANVVMPVGFNGVLELFFTADTGDMSLVFTQSSGSPFAAATNHGELSCSGIVSNL